MTQILVTLENGADSTFLRRMIENMKGVLRTSLENKSDTKSMSKQEKWLENLHNLKEDIKSSGIEIDMNDERTRYIMSK